MQAAQQKRFRDALKAFAHLAAAPPNPEVGTLAQYQIGYCYLALKQQQHALAAFEQFVQLHPHTPLTAPAQEKVRQLARAEEKGRQGDKGTRGQEDKFHPSSLIPHPASLAPADCGPAALLALCQRLGVTTTKEELARLAGTDATGTTMAGLAQAAKAKGLRVEGLWVDATAFQRLRLPALAWVNDNHWVAVLEVQGDKVTLFDPASEPRRLRSGQAQTISLADFQQQWNGYLLRVWKEGH
jgi:tetratricopeptide (TPR) repeat protein